MNRILTFAEFAKSFNQKGTDLGNSPADVDALMSSTDQFTADNSNGSCEDGNIDVVDGSGEKTVALVVGGKKGPEAEEEDDDAIFDEPDEDEDDEEEEDVVL